MKKISFQNPFLTFQKCDCLMQNMIKDFTVEEKDQGFILSSNVTCSVCGKKLERTYEITDETVDLSSEINAFKVVPTIKDELAIVKLDNFKCKIKDGELYFYGKYIYLRFFDLKFQEDTIPFYYYTF